MKRKPNLCLPFGRTILFFLTGCLALTSCISEESTPQTNCNDSDLTIAVLGQEDTQCNAADGTVTVGASGGTGAYSYKIGTRGFQSDAVFTSLAAGSYVVTVKDEGDCEATANVSILNKEGVNAEVAFTDSGCKNNEAAITITASNGIEPYQYKIGQNAFQDNNVFSNLTQGTYTVVTKDATGCEVSQQVDILSGISYATSVAPIIEKNCAISGCHNGTQSPDFRQFTNVQKNASSIKSQVVSKNMPKDGSLSQEQIDAISCWVDDGAKNN